MRAYAGTDKRTAIAAVARNLSKTISPFALDYRFATLLSIGDNLPLRFSEKPNNAQAGRRAGLRGDRRDRIDHRRSPSARVVEVGGERTPDGARARPRCEARAPNDANPGGDRRRQGVLRSRAAHPS